jgi:hypothetical protein
VLSRNKKESDERCIQLIQQRDRLASKLASNKVCAHDLHVTS